MVDAGCEGATRGDVVGSGASSLVWDVVGRAQVRRAEGDNAAHVRHRPRAIQVVVAQRAREPPAGGVANQEHTCVRGATGTARGHRLLDSTASGAQVPGEGGAIGRRVAGLDSRAVKRAANQGSGGASRKSPQLAPHPPATRSSMRRAAPNGEV